MNRRLLSAVLILVLTLQAWVVMPATFASSVSTHSGDVSEHCAGHTSQSTHKCPCCPTGATMAGCMSLCNAVGTGYALALPVIQIPSSAVVPFIAPAAITRTYAPLNPPPIA